MTKYTACWNTPGYLPTDDDPPTFDTAREAWQYLWQERDRAISDAYDGAADPDGDPWNDDETLDRLGANDTQGAREGVVTGPTPGYDGDHDLGIAYSVVESED